MYLVHIPHRTSNHSHNTSVFDQVPSYHYRLKVSFPEIEIPEPDQRKKLQYATKTACIFDVFCC